MSLPGNAHPALPACAVRTGPRKFGSHHAAGTCTPGSRCNEWEDSTPPGAVSVVEEAQVVSAGARLPQALRALTLFPRPGPAPASPCRCSSYLQERSSPGRWRYCSSDLKGKMGHRQGYKLAEEWVSTRGGERTAGDFSRLQTAPCALRTEVPETVPAWVENK